MADIVLFEPRAHVDASVNMAAFIALCREQLTVFGGDLDFDRDKWDISQHVELKARDISALVFSNNATSGRRKPTMMSEPFKSFAKGYIRHEHATNPTKVFGHRLRALRLIEAALLETGAADPVKIDSFVMNRAAELAKAASSNTAYATGNRLSAIANFLRDNRLANLRTSWKSPIKQPRTDRVGPEADVRRAQNMPTDAALDALPKAYRLATHSADVIVTSITAILCSAPDRVNEVLLLPANCVVREQRLDSDEEAYGLRWWPAKDAEPMVKWLVSTMSTVIDEAVRRISALTGQAREVARWYEKNPSKLYLPKSLRHKRKQEWLSMEEVNQILFEKPVHYTVARVWCRQNKVPFQKLDAKDRRIYARFKDVEAAVLKLLPRNFPYLNKEIGLKYSEALFTVLHNTLESKKSPMRCVVTSVNYDQVHKRLGSGDDDWKYQTVFDRCGLFDLDGSRIHLRTHQLRHYLNTLAQAGGLSQLDIAKWSGRKDINQNKVYDNEAPEVVVQRIREAIGDDTRMFGPLAHKPRAALIPRDEFARLKIPTAHTTDFGYCVHDYVMSPCQMHRDCLNCSEQICVKGEAEKEKRLRQAFSEATRLLEMAKQAVAEGEVGADEWMEHHQLKLARLSELLEIIDNPAVPVGAIIQLTPVTSTSRIDHAEEARSRLPGDAHTTTETAA